MTPSTSHSPRSWGAVMNSIPDQTTYMKRDINYEGGGGLQVGLGEDTSVWDQVNNIMYKPHQKP